MEEKRKDKRMDLTCEIVLNRLDIKDNENVRAAVTVKDVSKSGIGFTCNQTLSIGAVYECYLTIWTKEVIHTFIEIVRSYEQNGEFIYGGIFIGMPEMDMKRIEIYSTFHGDK